MCGRFKLEQPWEMLYALYKLSNSLNTMPRFNIAPTQQIPVVRPAAHGREAVNMRWGLIPFWSKDGKGAPLINAMAETITEKASFKQSFAKRRCLIPADGFYEWQTVDKQKLPWLFEIDNGALFSFAAIWDVWTPKDGGDPVTSCALITTMPNDVTGKVHNRMPVILPPECHEAWLSTETPVTSARAMLGPYPSDRMTARRVSTRLNAVRNEGRELLVAE